MYFMSTVCGRPQGGGGSGPCCGRMWTGGRGVKNVTFFWDVINGWPLMLVLDLCLMLAMRVLVNV